MQVEAHLQNPRENLQIPYPAGFPVSSKTHADDENIVAGYEPRYYTEAEIEVIQAWLTKLNYNQSIVLTGSILVGNDSLLEIATHDVLDTIEAQMSYPNSRFVDADAERAIRERVYIARELGYRGLPEIAKPEPEPLKEERKGAAEKPAKGREPVAAA